MTSTSASSIPCAPIRFAVTGASGFVGQHLVSNLLTREHQVTTLSRHGGPTPGTQFRRVTNYLDVGTLTAALSGAQVVVHLAARAHMLKETTTSVDQAFREANLDSTIAVAQASRAAGVRRLVVVSSIGVNGNRTDGRAFTDADAPNPSEPYAVSKRDAEIAVARTLADGACDYVILRPTLVYGNGCPGNFRLLLNLVQRLPVVPLGGLKAPRSLIHVDNLCDAIMLAARHPDVSRKTYVLSDGHDMSVAEIAKNLSQTFHGSPRRVVQVPEFLLRAVATVVGKGNALDKLASELAVDSSGFRNATEWAPPVTPTEGLAQTARWFMEQRTA